MVQEQIELDRQVSQRHPLTGERERPLTEQLQHRHERPQKARERDHFPDGLHAPWDQQAEAAGDRWDDNGNEYLWHQLTPGPLGFLP